MGERERLGKATARTLKVMNGMTFTGPVIATGFTDANGVTALSLAKKIVKVPLAAVDTAGGLFSWVNPEVGAIVVNRVTLDVTTVATGACSVSVGTSVVSAATSSANLIDTLDVHSATGVFDNLANGSTNGKMLQRLAAGGWVNGSKASGASAGIVGNAYIEYIVL